MRRLAFIPLLWSGSVFAAEEARPEALGPGSALQVVLALLFVLALIGVMAWLLRRFGNLPGGGGNGPLKVLTAVSVGQRERVVLVQIGEKQLLLGVAPGRVETLHVLEQPVDVNAAGGERFADRLAAAMRKRGG